MKIEAWQGYYQLELQSFINLFHDYGIAFDQIFHVALTYVTPEPSKNSQYTSLICDLIVAFSLSEKAEIMQCSITQ